MKIQPKFIAIAISLSSLFTPVHAQEKAWTLGSRTLPAPAAASDALRESIADTSQPDVAEHIRTTTFTINEEWVQTIQALNTFSMQRGEALPERRSVTIKKAEIAGVTVRTVTPTDINPANSNRLFVHLHGGAYVLNAGRAGLSEAIIIAHWVKIPVVSIDYRMPPEHPFPAAIVDVVAVWRSLLDDRPAKSMALGGTSAGGGLTLASTLRFVELGLDAPGALWLVTKTLKTARLGRVNHLMPVTTAIISASQTEKQIDGFEFGLSRVVA